MDAMYVDELRQSIHLLKGNLESVPVSKDSAGKGPAGKGRRGRGQKSDTPGVNSAAQGGPLAMKLSNGSGRDDPAGLSPPDIQLNFTIEVVIREVTGLKFLPPNKIVYCTMEVVGRTKLQTDQAEASKPMYTPRIPRTLE